MFPDPGRSRAARAAAAVLLAAALHAPPAGAVRLLNYNILNYPGSTGAARNTHFRTLLQPLAPDLVAVQEMQSQAGVDLFLSGVLNTLEPGLWSAALFIDGNDTDCGLFYKTAKFTLLGQWGFYPNPANQLRLVHVWRLRPAGYTSGAAEIRIYALHLKASSGSANEAQRAAEAAGLRDSMNAVPPGTHCIALGDFNLYSGNEAALTRMIENQADNDGRTYDPLGLQGIAWQDNASITWAHTQSPCKGTEGAPCASGAATGGLDDRFDLILPTRNWNDGQGYELVPGSYVPVGNDGLHLNFDIDSPSAPVIPEGAAYALALKSASDHLPVRVDLSLPARCSAPAGLALGTVLAGGGGTIAIGNPATPPADGLTYSFAAPVGFTAPAGTFELAAGAPDAVHAIATGAGPAGPRAGTLIVASDDPDQPARPVNLTAHVLRHSAASLEANAVVLAGSLDFGAGPPGSFPPLPVVVHNPGWDALQARLSLEGAAIAGGAGRFSIAGGFTAALVAGTPDTVWVAFDDAGATIDSTYEATLTLTGADEPLPGALAVAPVTVALAARVSTLPVGVAAAPPAATRLLGATPHPLAGAGALRFDLAVRAEVRLEVFDVRGRRVATVLERTFDPGRHSIAWNGRTPAGQALEPGLYFARLSGRGIAPQTTRIVLVR